MKTLKLFIPVIGLLLQFGVAKAGVIQNEGIFTKTHAIDTYVDAVMRGRLDGLDEVVDASAKFTLKGLNHLYSFNKQQMMGYLKANHDVEMNCTASTSVVENNGDLVVVKVAMQFPDFTRSNYVSIANTGFGWKIINVYSVYDNYPVTKAMANLSN